MLNKAIVDYIKGVTAVKIVASGCVKGDYKKVSVRPVVIGGRELFQIEAFTEKQAFHFNVEKSALAEWFEDKASVFRQYVVFAPDETATFLVSSKGKVTKRISRNERVLEVKTSHDSKKDRILPEGRVVPALVDLGVMNSEGKIIKAMSDKFRQIDRFIRIIHDAVSRSENESFTILDFGCGQSYLTFITYGYLTEILKKDVKIVGYDLKSDVVDFCNKTAERYGYKNLEFFVNDVNNPPFKGKVDMIMSLHACDTATDATLDFAVKNNVKYIFSVPCCQHEINSAIKKGGDLDIFMQDGIIKDRMSALLTDAIRAELLRNSGYEVSVLEFVEFAHSPKNLMLRAVYTGKMRNSHDIGALCEKYGFTQTLYKKLSDGE